MNYIVYLFWILLLPCVYFFISYFFVADKEKEKKIIKKFLKSLILAVIGLILWGVTAFFGDSYGINPNVMVTAPTLPTGERSYHQADFSSVSSMGARLTNGFSINNNININPTTPSPTDNREFMKVSYSGTVKTRDVSDATDRIKTLIKSLDGRIDNMQISDNNRYSYSSINFTLTKDNFYDFADQIEKLFPSKLYTKSISSYNKLGQKVALENQQSAQEDTRANLTDQKIDTTSDYNSQLAALNKKLAYYNNEIKTTKLNIANSTDTALLNTLNNDLVVYQNSANNIKSQISSLNAKYKVDLNNIQGQLDNNATDLQNTANANKSFDQDIDTVSGTIYIQYISIWAWCVIYFPIHPAIVLAILIMATLITIKIIKKRNYKKLQLANQVFNQNSQN